MAHASCVAMSRQDGVIGNSQKQESAASLRAHVQCVVSTGGAGERGGEPLEMRRPCMRVLL